MGHKPRNHGWNDESARWFAHKYGDWPTNHMVIDAIDLSPDDVLLDVGCGTGTALRHASQVITRGTLIGVDPTRVILDMARSQTAMHPANSRIEYRLSHAEALRVADESVDVAIAINSYHHWDDRERGLAQLRRVLAPGGRVHICEEHDVIELHRQTADVVRKALRGAGFSDLALQVVRDGDIVFDLHSAVR